MRINADFKRRAISAAAHYYWTPSPQSGVERVMLDRVGAEKARATSIVRYAPDSSFTPHPHPGGEEILVLSGTFSEGGADYPAGWYLRNPPGSSHQPSSREGSVIFVKLQQMSANERDYVRIDTRDPVAWHQQAGREVCPLFTSLTEHVCLIRLPPGDVPFNGAVNGAELLLMSGSLILGGQTYESGSWMRFPVDDSVSIHAGAQGAVLYLKTGHLADTTLEA